MTSRIAAKLQEMISGQLTHGRRRAAGVAASVVLAIVAGACGGGGDSVVLSEAGERGKRIALSSGCAGCHGTEGQGGSGPSWVGLAGSTVELQDGSMIVADDDYLVRSIADPGADLLADFALQMPQNRLGDAEIADVIAYIKDLSPADDAAG